MYTASTTANTCKDKGCRTGNSPCGVAWTRVDASICATFSTILARWRPVMPTEAWTCSCSSAYGTTAVTYTHRPKLLLAPWCSRSASRTPPTKTVSTRSVHSHCRQTLKVSHFLPRRLRQRQSGSFYLVHFGPTSFGGHWVSTLWYYVLPLTTFGRTEGGNWWTRTKSTFFRSVLSAVHLVSQNKLQAGGNRMTGSCFWSWRTRFRYASMRGDIVRPADRL